ncbi:hypothetical protein D3C81_1467340 [compost metagenome]
MAPSSEAMQPWMKSSSTARAGKPTNMAMPAMPSSSPARPCGVIFSSPQTRPISIENSGMVATKMAAIAVPMRGVAYDMPISCPATVVAPTTSKGTSSGRRRSGRRSRAARIARVPLAISARRLTAPTQPKACTTLSNTRNEKPQAMARNI